jgi:hypothetical protein
MAVVRVLINFSKMRDSALSIRAGAIVEHMTGNAYFTEPVPALSEVEAAITAYRSAQTDAQLGGIDKTEIKKQKRRALEDLLKSLAWYVQANCRNDLTILLSSGFYPHKARTPVGELEKPMAFKANNGPYPGSIQLSVGKVNGAGSYLFEYAPEPLDDTTRWTTQIVTARTCLVKGLTSGRQYAFRVAGIGTDPSRIYSHTITHYAPY